MSTSSMAAQSKVQPSYRFYRGCYRIARAVLGIVFWFDCKGKENIPPGAAMVCSNHSSVIDPIFIAFAFGIDHYLHFIAKVELFRIPVLSYVVIKLGAISVDRGMMDVVTLKRTLSYLKNGEKVAIFPEGTRSADVDAVAAKSGAVRLAERADVPLLPVFVPRKKKWFRKTPVVVGEPYCIEKQSGKRSKEELSRIADDLMHRIEALNPGV